MTKNSVRGGAYAWPGDPSTAMALIETVMWEKSSADCLGDYFLYMVLGSYDSNCYDSDEEEDLAESIGKSRQELREVFKDAKNWPLPYLVASAVYELVSKDPEIFRINYEVWRHLFWVFLLFDEPLFDMLRAKGWDKMYRDNIVDGLKSQLKFEIYDLTTHLILWSSDKDKPWFTCRNFSSRVYPKDVLRCLDLVGIDQDLAYMAVDQVFKLQNLTPFYNVLLDSPSLMAAPLLKSKDEQERADSSPKSSADLGILILNFLYGSLILTGAAIAFTRSRVSRSNWTSTAVVQSQQSSPFAAISRIGGRRAGPLQTPVEPVDPFRGEGVAAASQNIGPGLSSTRHVSWANLRSEAQQSRAKLLHRINPVSTLIKNATNRWSIFASPNDPSESQSQEKMVEDMIRQRKVGWFKGGRILTHESSETQNSLEVLKAKDKH